MKNKNEIREKSYVFAVKIARLYKELIAQKRCYELAKQLLRSGTSIGANAEEAIGSFSRRELAAKIAISYKEARETNFWLHLLQDINYLDANNADILLKDVGDILKILGAIQLTLKNNS